MSLDFYLGRGHCSQTPMFEIPENVWVGPSGFEPLTSSVSGKRSPPELRARSAAECTYRGDAGNRTRVTGFADPCLTTRPRRHVPADRRGRTGRGSRNDTRGWSGRRGSNPRPQPWQGCALPTELLPRGDHHTHGPSSVAQAPVEPKPPSPRAVAGNSEASISSTSGTATTTIWAIRSPRRNSTDSDPWLTSRTWTSPR